MMTLAYIKYFNLGAANEPEAVRGMPPVALVVAVILVVQDLLKAVLEAVVETVIVLSVAVVPIQLGIVSRLAQFQQKLTPIAETHHPEMNRI